MDLKQFLHFLHRGASSAWESVIQDLTGSDLKALRLALDPPLANAIFPYMFSRLFFSVHDEDHEAFRHVSNHPIASRRINQIFWDGAVCKTLLLREDAIPGVRKEQLIQEYELHFRRDLGIMWQSNEWMNDDRMNEVQRPTSSKSMAMDFWAQKEKAWSQVVKADADLSFLKHALSQLPNLRRINILAETEAPCVPSKDYLRLWPTPRARLWAKLHFHQLLLVPRPKLTGKGNQSWYEYSLIPRDTNNANEVQDSSQHFGFLRTLKFLSNLSHDRHVNIGSIIIDSYGRSQLPAEIDSRLHLDTQPFRNFDSVIDGYASTVPDLEQPHRLTLRLMIEIVQLRETLSEVSAPQPSLWSGGKRHNLWVRDFDILALNCQHSLEEMTYCRVDLKKLLAYYREGNLENDGICHLTSCTQLRRVRFYECWCRNVFETLHWLWHNTTVREVELHSVASTSTSWYAVMMDLRAQGILFNVLNVVMCRSPNELWGPGFAPEILAPWNGESKDVVPWLRGERDEFPLWQGPG